MSDIAAESSLSLDKYISVFDKWVNKTEGNIDNGLLR